MINKDIINVKNILKIVISILVIVSMFKSCAQAYNSTQAQVDEVNANIVRVANYFGIEHYPIYNTSTLTYWNINKYVIFITASDSPKYPNTMGAFFPSVDPLTTSYNGSPYIKNGGTKIVNINNGTQTGVSGSGIYTSIKYRYIYTQVDWTSATGQNLNAGDEVGATILTVPPNPLEFNHIGSQTITVNGEEAQAITTLYSFETTLIEGLQGFTSGEPIYFSLTNTATEQKYENTYTFVDRILSRNSNNSFYAEDLGSYMSISIRTRYINFNTIYSLYLKQGENELQEYIIFYPIGTTFENGTVETMPSGDFSYNNQDSTNDTINAINNQTSIFENLYNQMLTPSGDKIKAKLEETLEAMQMPSRRDRNGNSRLRRYK